LTTGTLPTRPRTTNWRIYRDLRDNADASLIDVKTIDQFFDPERTCSCRPVHQGRMPQCHAKEQYGDNCEVCGAVYAPPT
jgi:methionyl-tRNA synthetase